MKTIRKTTSDGGEGDGGRGYGLAWGHPIDDGPDKRHLGSGLHITRFEEEKDAEEGKSAYDQDYQEKELPAGWVAPYQAVTGSGGHAGSILFRQNDFRN
jgi:hypothetical protein